MPSLAETLRKTRGLAGISAGRLGVISGLSRGAVSMLESGARTNPEVTTVRALAATLGVSTDYLLSGEGDEPTEEQVRTAVERTALAFEAARDGAA